jgi:hypothetical protein
MIPIIFSSSASKLPSATQPSKSHLSNSVASSPPTNREAGGGRRGVRGLEDVAEKVMRIFCAEKEREGILMAMV